MVARLKWAPAIVKKKRIKCQEGGNIGGRGNVF